MKIILIILLLDVSIFAQSDWKKWEAKSVSFELSSFEKKNYSIDSTNLSTTVLSFLRNGYYFFISDLDGDNCPFHPSCSRFFIEAVKETNLFQGLLMFADRFTRDINFLRSVSNYSIQSNGKLLDPAFNYTLNIHKITIK